MTKHMFAGASTPVGFVDFFDNIMPLEGAKNRIYLKGSSGSGKSTFMKKVAAKFEGLGVYTEAFHCSNDAESLDAIAFRGIGLCIIDATMPHSHDPEVPIAVDRLIDFAQFIDKGLVERYGDELKSLLITKRLLTKGASDHLKALGHIYNLENTLGGKVQDKRAIRKLAKELLDGIDAKEHSSSRGHERKLFLSAITPDGFVSFADSYFSDCTVYSIASEAKAGSIALAGIRDEALSCGMHIESFHNPFSPKELEYLHLPQAGAVFAAAGNRFGYRGKATKLVDISGCFNDKVLGHTKSDDVLGTKFDELLDSAVQAMYKSREAHIKIEKIYASTMDFKRANAVTEKIIEGLLP